MVDRHRFDKKEFIHMLGFSESTFKRYRRVGIILEPGIDGKWSRDDVEKQIWLLSQSSRLPFMKQMGVGPDGDVDDSSDDDQKSAKK